MDTDNLYVGDTWACPVSPQNRANLRKKPQGAVAWSANITACVYNVVVKKI